MDKLAVLIDADNASSKQINPIFEEIAKYGIASVKRIYGDWSIESLKNWKEVLLPLAITPIQQFAYVSGKDATDMILIIDAMDLIYAGNLDGFCIISSDSDFTPLASRIRQSGLKVYGFGTKNTNKSFVNSCDKFIYVENLDGDSSTEPDVESSININKSKVGNTEFIKYDEDKSVEIDQTTLNLLYRAMKDCQNEDGWANLALVGQYMINVKPDFDPRTYGSPKLSSLLKNLTMFELKNENSQIFARKFNFHKLINSIQSYAKTKKGEWLRVTEIVEYLCNQENVDTAYPDKQDIKRRLYSIHSKWVTFSTDGESLKLAK